MTVFDIVTIACFVSIVFLFFAFTDRDPRVLLRFLLAGAALAVANQVGNHGYPIVAAALVAAAVTYVATQFIKSA